MSWLNRIFAKKGANADITSLSGLTIPLSTGQGGTDSNANANTANGVVKLDANAKLPHAALKTYDSGWFAITTTAAYTKTHNLGTTKALVCIYISENSDGSGRCALLAGWRYPGNPTGTCVAALSTTQITLRTFENGVFNGIDSAGVYWDPTSGYAKIVMLVLE